MFVPLQLLMLLRIYKAIRTHRKLYALPTRALGFDFCTVDVYVDADENASSSDIQLTINSVFGLSYSRLNTIYVCCSDASAEAIAACKPEADQLQVQLKQLPNFRWGQPCRSNYALYVEAGVLIDADVLLRLWSNGKPEHSVKFMGRLCPDVQSTWLWLKYAVDQMHCGQKESMVLVPPNTHASTVYTDARVNKLHYSVKQPSGVNWTNFVNQLNGAVMVLMCATGHVLEAFGYFIALFAVTMLLLSRDKVAHRHRMFLVLGVFLIQVFTADHLTMCAAPVWYFVLEVFLSYRCVAGFLRGGTPKVKQDKQ